MNRWWNSEMSIISQHTFTSTLKNHWMQRRFVHTVILRCSQTKVTLYCRRFKCTLLVLLTNSLSFVCNKSSTINWITVENIGTKSRFWTLPISSGNPIYNFNKVNTFLINYIFKCGHAYFYWVIISFLQFSISPAGVKVIRSLCFINKIIK